MNTPFRSLGTTFTSRACTMTIGLCLASGMAACGPNSVMLHSQTGEPILVQESAYTAAGCRQNLEEEAQRIGMPLRSTDVKGSLFGDTLLWPFVKGYVCLGTDQDLPIGVVGTTSLYRG